MSSTRSRRWLRPYPGRSGTTLTQRLASLRAVGIRYAPEIAKPWTCTIGTPVPPVLRRQSMTFPSTSSRSVTQPSSVNTAGSSHGQ